MYTIVGLGNPGGEYAKTRHNAGRLLVEKLAEQNGIELKQKKKPDYWVGTGEVIDSRVRLVVPDTFMNNSGKAVVPFIKNTAAAKSLIVVHDDIDLPFGCVRVSFGSSSGGHNGIKSIQRAVKTKESVRVRIGVAKASRGKAKKPVGEDAVHDFLLGTFTKGELEKLLDTIYKRTELALETIIETKDPVMGMNEVNGLPLV